MELGVSHVQNLSSLPPVVDNTFDKYNKNLVPIRSLSDHDINKYMSSLYFDDKYVTCKIKTDSWFWKKKGMLDKLWVLIYILYHHVAVK